MIKSIFRYIGQQEERERKEREEQEKIRKAKMEAELKKQQELEKELQRQRELEQEREEQRKRELEKKELARKYDHSLIRYYLIYCDFSYRTESWKSNVSWSGRLRRYQICNSNVNVSRKMC